jgi:protein-S-isoprenylcysteine O-methyltransferase Ste14
MTGGPAQERVTAWGFVVVQSVLLGVVLLLPGGDGWSPPAPVAWASRAIGLAGAALLVAGLVGLGRALTPLPTPVTGAGLRTGGPYRLVRHPIYAGLLAVAVGSAVPSGSAVRLGAAVALIAWLAAKARWEERLLRARHPGYAAYAARTPRFLPGWPFGADRR